MTALILGGEVLQSAFHFILNLVLVRHLSTAHYGIFALTFVLGGVVLAYCGALCSIPANVAIARKIGEAPRRALEVTFGSVALVLSGFIAVLVAGGMWLSFEAPVTGLLSGFFVGAWAVRNHVRTVILARGAAGPAALTDLAYAGLGIGLVGTLFVVWPLSLDLVSALAMLCAANLAGIVTGLLVRRGRARISFRRSSWRPYRAMLPAIGWSLASVTTTTLQAQGLTFLVVGLAGAAAYAPIAAAALLFSPLRLAGSALLSVMRPALSRSLGQGQLGAVQQTLFTAIYLAIAGCLLFGILLWTAWPFLRSEIFGNDLKSEPMGLIVVVSWTCALAYSVYNILQSLAQANFQFRETMMAGLFGTAAGALSIPIIIVQGTAYSVFGWLLSEVVVLVVLSRTTSAILTRSAKDVAGFRS